MTHNAPSQNEYGQKRILLLEDDISTAELVSLLFAMGGYQCTALSQIPDIIAAIIEFRPDLILIDYFLPDAKGSELCRQVKTNTATKHIPVIIYSAYPAATCLKDHPECDAFIIKPFDIDELSATVSQLLAKAQSPEIQNKPAK